MYSMDKESYGGFFMEGAFVTSHQFGLSAQQTVLVENSQLIVTQIRPLGAEFFGPSTSI